MMGNYRCQQQSSSITVSNRVPIQTANQNNFELGLYVRFRDYRQACDVCQRQSPNTMTPLRRIA